MIKFNVTTLSQPATFVVVQVGVVVDEVYNIPCHLNESQAVKVSVDEVGTLIVKCRVSVVVHPEPDG